MKNLIDCEDRKEIGIMTKEFVENDYRRDGKSFATRKKKRRGERLERDTHHISGSPRVL